MRDHTRAARQPIQTLMSRFAPISFVCKHHSGKLLFTRYLSERVLLLMNYRVNKEKLGFLLHYAVYQQKARLLHEKVVYHSTE